MPVQMLYGGDGGTYTHALMVLYTIVVRNARTHISIPSIA